MTEVGGEARREEAESEGRTGEERRAGGKNSKRKKLHAINYIHGVNIYFIIMSRNKQKIQRLSDYHQQGN